MSALAKTCSRGAVHLLTRTSKPISQMTTAEVIAYTQRAVALGAHLALNWLEREATKGKAA